MRAQCVGALLAGGDQATDDLGLGLRVAGVVIESEQLRGRAHRPQGVHRRADKFRDRIHDVPLPPADRECR